MRKTSIYALVVAGLFSSAVLMAGAQVSAATYSVAIVAECEFAAPPTSAQFVACQQAMQNSAASQQPSVVQPSAVDDSALDIPAMGPPSDIQMGPSEEQMAKINMMKLKGMKRGVKGMEMGLSKIEAQYVKLEKSGVNVVQTYKDKLAEARSMVNAIKDATEPEQIENIDTDNFSDLLDELGNGIGEMKQQVEMLKGLKRAAKSMKSGVSMFDKQIAKMVKQGIQVPDDIAENLKSVKDIIAGIESNKSWEELQALGIENIDELFDKLDDGRERVIMLSRWPMAQKQIDKQLAVMGKLSGKLSVIAGKLNGDIDVSGYVTKFNDGVMELKQVRDNAVDKIKSGAGMEAFDELEGSFFGKLDEVYENQRIIETMAGMNKFATEYKKGLVLAKKQIAQLVKKKVKTKDAQLFLDQFKAKGDIIMGMIKQKPLDEAAIMGAVDEFENLRTNLVDKISALAGEKMPWEQGKPELLEVKIPKELDQFVTKKVEKEQKEQKPTDVLPKQTVLGQGILIEAEDEMKSYILPASKRPAVNMEEINPSWRPPYSGTGDWYLAAGGEWLEYKIDISVDGAYQFWIRDYVDKYQPKGVRRVVITFDGSSYGTFSEVDKVTTSAKGDFGWHKVGTGITLTKGTHVMKAMKEDTTSGAVILDAFYLTVGVEVPAEK